MLGRVLQSVSLPVLFCLIFGGNANFKRREIEISDKRKLLPTSVEAHARLEIKGGTGSEVRSGPVESCCVARRASRIVQLKKQSLGDTVPYVFRHSWESSKITRQGRRHSILEEMKTQKKTNKNISVLTGAGLQAGDRIDFVHYRI